MDQEHKPHSSYRIDLLVPVYNEKENFLAFYHALLKYAASDWRLMIIYDFPEDTTLEAARPIAEKDPRVVLVQNRGRGVLNAILTGFEAAESEAILEMMVDDPPSVIEKIDEMVRVFYEKNAAVVAASRYMPGGSHKGGPFLKGFLSRMAGLSLNWLIRIPIHDATYNTRLYRKSFIQKIPLESDKGFEIALEITIKAYLMGETVAEVPVHWFEDNIRPSRFNFRKWLPAYLRWYWYGIKNYWFNGISKS